VSIPVLDDVVAVVSPLVADLAGLLAGVGGAAAAIVLCTIALRLLLLPLTLRAVRGERARAALAPQLARLRERHGTDYLALSTEMTALHKNAGVSPLAGLGPMLAQAPFFIVWFRIFTVPGTDGGLLADTFLGAALSSHLTWAFIPLLGVLAAVAAATAWRGRRVAAANGTPAPPAVFAALPFLVLVSALFLPLAAVLYLATTTTWTLAESVALRRGLPARRAQSPVS
jgi:YidC/Oxa1 family membrane protein insertase